MERIRTKFNERGVRGMINISRTFRVIFLINYFQIIDDDNSKNIDFAEFKKACKDLRFGLSDREIEISFKAFDSNGNGNIDYEEFLAQLRVRKFC